VTAALPTPSPRAIQAHSTERIARPDVNAVWLALDAIRDGVVIADAAGSVCYSNAAARRLLDDGGLPLVRAIDAAIADALSEGFAGLREAGADERRFELRATPYASAAGATGVLVVVTCTSLQVPSAESIARRHGLSRREAAVAGLLARGSSNDTIVEALGISASTARHYTERVLAKLGTRSRGAAAAIILGTTDERASRAARVVEL
jgi:DNA-binding CsgD family transcriptional regulator